MKKAKKPEPTQPPTEESKKPRRTRKVFMGLALVATGVAGAAFKLTRSKSASK
jgi:hypothetical protein